MRQRKQYTDGDRQRARQIDRWRQTESQTDRQMETDREVAKQKDRWRQTESYIDRYSGQIETENEIDRWRQRQIDRWRQTESQTDRLLETDRELNRQRKTVNEIDTVECTGTEDVLIKIKQIVIKEHRNRQIVTNNPRLIGKESDKQMNIYRYTGIESDRWINRHTGIES